MKPKDIGLVFVRIPLTAFKVLTNPFVFFKKMPKTGGYFEPMLFMVVMGCISSCLVAAQLHFQKRPFESFLVSISFLVELMFMFVAAVVNAVLQILFFAKWLQSTSNVDNRIVFSIAVPIFFAIFSFVAAAIMFVIWRSMGSRKDYETSYKCVAYLSAITPVIFILSPIPYYGTIAGIVIITFFLVTASVKTHRINYILASIQFGIIAIMLIRLTNKMNMHR